MKPYKSETIKPLPCPFCGCKTVSVTDGTTFRWARGECDNCGASCGEVRVNTMQTRNEEEIRAAVIEEWNRRHNVEVTGAAPHERTTKR